MTSVVAWICSACEHFDRETLTCPAFPERIPLEPGKKPLLHDEVLPGQVGATVFKLKEDDLMAEFTYEELLQTQEALDEREARDV